VEIAEMITDVPSPDDFRVSGMAFLNLAWGTAIGLACELDDAAEFGIETAEVSDAYWAAAQRPLSTAASLVQQGTEFLLKARIAEVSPYLLIARPSDLPAGSQAQDIPFSKFKTVDAQDLIRIHNAVATARLSDQFNDRFEKLRQQRNTIMHTVDPGMRFTAKELIEAILEISEDLVGARSWVTQRRSYLDNDTSAALGENDHVGSIMATEFLKVIDLLQPVQLRRFFGLEKRQRRYRCKECEWSGRDWGQEVPTAQLRPTSESSKSVYCFVCEQTTAVERRPCRKCKGNVIEGDDGMCLTCGTDN
jgi:hypothetical protein